MLAILTGNATDRRSVRWMPATVRGTAVAGGTVGARGDGVAAAALVSTRSTAVTGWARRLGAGDARRAMVSDAAITTALTLLGAVAVADGSFDATVGPEIPAAPAAVPWLLQAVFTLPLLWRRAHAVGALWTVIAACDVMIWWGLDHPGALGALVVA